MGKVLLIFVVLCVMVGGIIFLFRLMFSDRKLLENAKRRFTEAFKKLSELKGDYFIQEKVEYYNQAEIRLLKSSAESDLVEWYERKADEIEEILESPATFLSHKVYDPVDSSLLQEDAVEVVCDHPTAGKVYVVVNRWNVDKVEGIFNRKIKHRTSHRLYRMRMDRELPQDVKVIHQDDGITLTDILLLNYLLTDHPVHVYSHDEPVQVRHTYSADEGAAGFDGQKYVGHEEPPLYFQRQRPADDDDVIPTMAPSGDTGFFSRTFESEPERDAPIEHNFGGGESGGGGASGSLDDDPVIVDPFESSHVAQESSHEAVEVHEIEVHDSDFHSSEPDTSSHEDSSGTAY